METIFSMLARDHALSDLLFSRACCQVRAHDFNAAAAALTELSATLERHFQIEEELVFTAYDALVEPKTSSTAMLRAEHRQVLGVLKRMAESIAEGDGQAFLKHAGTLRLVLQLHNEKEEKVFYPMVESLLQAQRGPIHAALVTGRGGMVAGLA